MRPPISDADDRPASVEQDYLGDLLGRVARASSARRRDRCTSRKAPCSTALSEQAARQTGAAAADGGEGGCGSRRPAGRAKRGCSPMQGAGSATRERRRQSASQATRRSAAQSARRTKATSRGPIRRSPAKWRADRAERCSRPGRRWRATRRRPRRRQTISRSKQPSEIPGDRRQQIGCPKGQRQQVSTRPRPTRSAICAERSERSACR